MQEMIDRHDTSEPIATLRKVEAAVDIPNPAAIAQQVTGALDASSSSAELWRGHAAQIRSLAETVALHCEHLAAVLDERAKKFAGMVEMFALYAAATEDRIAAEHQRLAEANAPEPPDPSSPS